MNKIIENLLKTKQPKIQTLDKREKMLYEVGLGVLGSYISENFFDIPHLPKDKYSQNGLFYEIPYYDSDQLWCSDNQRMLLVVYQIKNKTSFCPLRIDFNITDKNNFNVWVYDQSGERTIKILFLGCENNKYFTEIDDYEKVKLSELVNVKSFK
ncbi:hypothetical protein [Clostridium sp.]|uniref:hypothetical protein n=1 Tax=Clostridium sp. TaxID=1506 RepID=UPI0026140048|nr:hypothetical protein [Clostridium sp.]